MPRQKAHFPAIQTIPAPRPENAVVRVGDGEVTPTAETFGNEVAMLPFLGDGNALPAQTQDAIAPGYVDPLQQKAAQELPQRDRMPDPRLRTGVGKPEPQRCPLLGNDQRGSSTEAKAQPAGAELGFPQCGSLHQGRDTRGSGP